MGRVLGFCLVLLCPDNLENHSELTSFIVLITNSFIEI